MAQPGGVSSRIEFCSKEYPPAGYRPVLECFPANPPKTLAAMTGQTTNARARLSLIRSAAGRDLPDEFVLSVPIILQRLLFKTAIRLKARLWA